MASYSVTVPHKLGQATALARVERFLDDMRRDYADRISDVRGQWSGNRLQFGFSASGISINGTLEVEENAVHVNGPLPLMAAMFRGRIEQTIRDDLERLLS